MDDKTFTVNIYTPEALFLSDQTVCLSVQSTDGSFGLMRGHTPCVIALTEGKILLKNGKNVRTLNAGAGFLEMQNNVASIFVNVCTEVKQDD